LHRTIMLSATYRTSSRGSKAAHKLDPGNRLYGRTSIRRLEAEEIRDSMLALGEALDRSQGGPAIATENRKHVFDHTSKDDTTYADDCRSVYLPVIRNHLHESLTLFDYTDASVPTGDRPSSTVVSQSLYLLNSEFVVTAARRLSDRLERLTVADDVARLESLYEITLGRLPSVEELEQARTFLDRVQSQATRKQAWQMLCHNLLISNEFFYLR
jgi:hypothetical protein